MKTTFFDPNKFNKIINRGVGLECEAEGGRGGGGGGARKIKRLISRGTSIRTLRV